VYIRFCNAKDVVLWKSRIDTSSRQLRIYLFSDIDVKDDWQTQTTTKTCKLVIDNYDEVDIMKVITYFNMTSYRPFSAGTNEFNICISFNRID
jgi:hypothetical protein